MTYIDEILVSVLLVLIVARIGLWAYGDRAARRRVTRILKV